MGNMVGGASKTTLHLINSTHTTVTTAVALALGQQVKTALNKDGADFDTIQNDVTTNTFVETYAATASSSNPEKVTLETGTDVEAGASSSAQNFVSISYEGTIVDGGTTKRAVTCYVGTLKDDTGDHDLEAGKFSRLKFGVVGTNAVAAIVVPAACFDAALVTVTTGPTIPLGRKRVRAFFAVP